ncbi:TIGR04222 domain-containing membrane protein [Nocardia sp. NPDC004722]
MFRVVAAAAASDTWGISGPDFLRYYLAVALGAAALGFAWRTKVLRRVDPAWPSTAPLRPTEIGMLIDDQRPILAVLAQLRAHELIDSRGNAVRKPNETERRSLDPATAELRTHLGTGRPPAEAPVHVNAAVQVMRDDLVTRGYLLGDRQHEELWWGAIPIAAVIAVGVVRVIHGGLISHHPVAWLEGIMIGLGVLVWLLVRPARLTRRGRAALAEARARNRYLRPANSPAFSAYGPDCAALAAALFGVASLRALDPALARALAIVVGGSVLGGSVSGSYGGSSCGSGSSGGGGGGCGGGGGGCGG